MNKITSLLAGVFLFGNLAAQTTIITTGATWKYLDNGSNQGTAWYGTGFNDASWASGPSELGYGDGDEATVVSYGPSSSNKYPTTYFRKTQNITTPSSFANFTLNVKRDDGIVVYVNGVEVYRDNMNAGAPAYNNYSSGTCSDDGSNWLTTTIATSAFVSGNNVIAAEVHQANGTSSDLTFDLELIGNPTGGGSPGTTLSRGPYLQLATQSSIFIRWRTATASISEVKYGTVAGSLTNTVTGSVATTEHEVQITGLTADTKYYYSIGTPTGTLQSGTNNFFYTLPVAGTEQKYTIWATGDCGTGLSTQTNVKNQFVSYIGSNKVDGWILLGDNAYNSGTDNEFQNYFFNQYPNQLKNITLWPAPGNHDYYSSSTQDMGDPNISYFKQFTLPTAGEAGGVASGTKAYYSYNIGNIHMVSLDSYGEEGPSNKMMQDTTGPQITWLKQDLAANTQKWVVVYFHHSPFTKGSHNSDTESDLTAIRNKVTRILERYKVDLILTGHSHSYERSKLQNGFYGAEGTFSAATHQLSSSSALYDGTANSCPYIKNGNAKGSIYCVAGNAGQSGGTSSGWPHNMMYFSDASRGGSFVIEVDHNRMDCKYICDDGVIRDKFTIMKDVNQVTNLSIGSGSNVNLTASWIGSYNWTPVSGTTQTVNVSPTVTTSYYVTDQYNCLKDTFNVTISAVAPTAAFTMSSSSVCVGQVLSLTDQSTNGPSSWVWTMPGGTPSGSSTQNPTVTYTTPGSYTIALIASNVNGSSAPVNHTVTVLASPTVGINPSATTICQGQSVTLAGTGAVSYTWTGGVVNNTPFTPSISDTYTVTGTAANGCTSTSSVTVNLNPLPLISIFGTSTICAGNSTTLSGIGASSYSWNTGATTSAITVSPTTTTTYTLTGTDVNNCSNTATKTITVNPLPTVNTAASDDSVCVNGNLIVLTGMPSGGAFSGTGVAGSMFDPNVAGPGTHVVTYTYTDGNSCTNTATAAIVVDICSGVNNITTTQGISIYPNPNNGIFSVRLNRSNNGKLSLVNELGQLIESFELNGSLSKKDFNLQAGTYFIVGEIDGTKVKQKISVIK